MASRRRRRINWRLSRFHGRSRTGFPSRHHFLCRIGFTAELPVRHRLLGIVEYNEHCRHVGNVGCEIQLPKKKRQGAIFLRRVLSLRCYPGFIYQGLTGPASSEKRRRHRMPHRVEPSISETAFSCPYCSALTTQFWYDVFVDPLKGRGTSSSTSRR
jgi:hypothetical protein